MNKLHDDKLSVTILGCGSSGGVPRLSDGWGLCDPNNIKNNLERQVNSKKISAAKSNAALNLINYTVSLEEFGDVDLVIEAATENESVKQKIFNSKGVIDAMDDSDWVEIENK